MPLSSPTNFYTDSQSALQFWRHQTPKHFANTAPKFCRVWLRFRGGRCNSIVAALPLRPRWFESLFLAILVPADISEEDYWRLPFATQGDSLCGFALSFISLLLSWPFPQMTARLSRQCPPINVSKCFCVSICSIFTRANLWEWRIQLSNWVSVCYLGVVGDFGLVLFAALV